MRGASGFVLCYFRSGVAGGVWIRIADSIPTGWLRPRGFLGVFSLKQSCDGTAKHALDQLRVIHGQRLEPELVPSYCYFCIIKDKLYRVARDTQTEEIIAQLVGKMFFLFHLGQDKALNRLMSCFC